MKGFILVQVINPKYLNYFTNLHNRFYCSNTGWSRGEQTAHISPLASLDKINKSSCSISRKILEHWQSFIVLLRNQKVFSVVIHSDGHCAQHRQNKRSTRAFSSRVKWSTLSSSASFHLPNQMTFCQETSPTKFSMTTFIIHKGYYFIQLHFIISASWSSSSIRFL